MILLSRDEYEYLQGFRKRRGLTPLPSQPSTLPREPPPTKQMHCLACGKELTQRGDERNVQFNKRTTCGHGCSAVLRSKPVRLKQCAVCSEIIPRNGLWPARYNIKKTCGTECFAVLRKKRGNNGNGKGQTQGAKPRHVQASVATTR